MNGPRWPRAARRWCVPSPSCAEPRCNGVTAAWRSATALLHASAAVRGVGSGRQLCWIAGGLAGWREVHVQREARAMRKRSHSLRTPPHLEEPAEHSRVDARVRLGPLHQ
jgi:hypothetical protein